MNVIAIKLVGFECNPFSRSCLVGGHLLFLEFHTVEYIKKLCAAANVVWPRNWS